MVWCGIPKNEVIGPYFFQNEMSLVVRTKECYPTFCFQDYKDILKHDFPAGWCSSELFPGTKIVFGQKFTD